MSKKVFNKNWKKYADVWLKVTPPWRPSPFEVKKYSQFLQKEFGKKRNKHALILGSTPEFRDLLNRHQFQVTCLDVNREMFQAMETVMKTEPTKERLKIGNWLDQPFKKNYFDLVISDEALDNIAFKDYLSFHKNVYDYLKDGGYYLYGCYYLVNKSFLPKEIRSGKFKALIEFYRKKPGWFKNFSNKEIIYQAFINNHNKEYFDQQKWQIKFGWYEQSLLNFLKRKKIDQAVYRALSFNLGLDAKFTQLYKGDYEKIFKKFFKIIQIDQDPSYSFHNKSLYIMKRK